MINHRSTDTRYPRSVVAAPNTDPTESGPQPSLSRLSPGFTTKTHTAAAREAVEGPTCFANQLRRDRNGLRLQVRSVRTQDQTRSAYLQTRLKQAQSYGLEIPTR